MPSKEFEVRSLSSGDFSYLAGLEGPPTILVNLVKELAADRQLQAWLRKQGQNVANMIWKRVAAALTEPGKKNEWVEMLSPLFQPFIWGLQDVINEKLMVFSVKLSAVGVGVGVLGGLIVGSARRKELTSR